MPTASSPTVLAADDLADIEPAWRRRQATTWSGDPAASWEWLAAGARRLAPEQALLLVGSADDPVAVLRLMRVASLRLGLPLGAGIDRMALCPGTDPETARLATYAARRIASIWLPSMAAGTIASGSSDCRRRHGETLSIDVRDWDEYYASRSPSLRKTLRSAHNRRRRPGANLSVSTLPSGAMTSHLAALSAVEAAGHRKHGYLLSHKRTGSFTAEWLQGLDASGHVRTNVASADGTICAYLIGIVTPQRYLAYSMAMLASHRQYALGHLLFEDAIRGALARGEAVDLGNGTTEFKLRWATSATALEDVFIGGRLVTPIARIALGAYSAALSARAGAPFRHREEEGT